MEEVAEAAAPFSSASFRRTALVREAAAAAGARTVPCLLTCLPPPTATPLADLPAKVHGASTADQISSTWIAFFSYMLFPPTYLVGPVLTASDYLQQAAARAAGRCTTAALTGALLLALLGCSCRFSGSWDGDC